MLQIEGAVLLVILLLLILQIADAIFTCKLSSLSRSKFETLCKPVISLARHAGLCKVTTTNDLKQRIQDRYAQRGQKTSFTGKYYAYYLVYYEHHKYINNAIAREKEIKGWTRKRRMKLINEMNPPLKFLNEELFGAWPPKEIESRL